MARRLDIYRRLLGYLRPHLGWVAVAYFSMFTATLINLFVPQIIKQAIDRGLATGSASTLYWAGGLILAIAVVRGAVAFLQRYSGEWLTHRVAYELRNDFYAAVQTLPFSFHNRAKTGDLMSRATSDITETERFSGIGLLDLTATILLLVGVSVAMFLENVRLAAMVMVPMAGLVVTALYFGNVIRPMFKQIQEQMGVLSTTMQESMTGIGVVKAFAREPYELEKFDHQNNLWFEKRYEAIRIWASFWPMFTFILAVAILLLLWFGGAQAVAGTTTIGSLFAMISYVVMLNAPVSRLGFLVNMAATASASATRVFEIMDTPNEVQEPVAPAALPTIRGDVRFDNVSFAYAEGASTLKEISFEVKAGQVVALIGPTGAGKSTIINLVPRFYDPAQGRVLIDDVDVQSISLHRLRQAIGIVLQDPFLFNATIAENISYGKPDSPKEAIIAAAKAAAAHDFIMTFPDDYETVVGERGVTLSGGQKQRIAIARAILRDPRILILDDSTSSVDTETEHIIQQALQVLMEGRTTFVIAQRLLTLKNADKILVLDQGRIVQRGTHDELLAESGLYREIYDLQLKDQEEFMARQEQGQVAKQGEPRS